MNKLHLSKRFFCSGTKPGKTIQLTLHFTNKDIKKTISASCGKTLLEIFKENNIPNIGVCDGKLVCGTCHCILPQKLYDQSLNEEVNYQEEDLLSVAIGVKDTSRLGCQVVVDESFDGEVIEMPPISSSEFMEDKV